MTTKQLDLIEVTDETAQPEGASPAVDAAAPTLDLDLSDPPLYINRELSLLQFNYRVLAEALDADRHPLLERVKFLSIFFNNIDEIFMTRVSGLRRQLAAGVVEAPPDGMTPAEQLAAIRRDLVPMVKKATACWHEDLAPKLAATGIHVLSYDQLKGNQRRLMRRHFEREIFPVLTPLAFDPGHPFPHISNLSINLAVVVEEPGKGRKLRPPEDSRHLPPPVADPGGDAGRELRRSGTGRGRRTPTSSGSRR